MSILVVLALVACNGGNVNVNGVDVDDDGFVIELDCDDRNAAVNPNATEVCNGRDDDCNGTKDDDMTLYVFHPDDDRDGYGDPAETTEGCTSPDGYVQNDKDCNDQDDKVRPSAVDVCNDIDDDCTGVVDDDPDQAPPWYVDADGDGHGTDTDAVVRTCDPQEGLATTKRDCDDTNAAVHPDADDVCNGIDDDCDGKADNDIDFKPKWYDDDDGDGFGDTTGYSLNCVQPEGYIDNAEDCDDTRDTVFPGGIDVCNKLDDDCDGEIDNDPENFVPWFVDLDKDGWGTTAIGVVSCIAPDKSSSMKEGDCNDTDKTVHPEAQELCNSLDEDCDAIIDEEGKGAKSWYPDADKDGYGVTTGKVVQCVAPTGSVEALGDCDDANKAIYPTAKEVCNREDDDCDTQKDESAVDAPHWYADADADDFGNPTKFTIICDAPAGTVANRRDCDDGDPDVYPLATDEFGDEIDGDCDGRDCEADFDAKGVYVAVCFEDDDWYAAEKWCDDVGYGGLAAPTTAAEQTYLTDLLAAAGKTTSEAPWIGLSDEAVEGTWALASGSKATFLAWSTGRPDGDENDNCAQLNWPLGSGTWNDLSCDAARVSQATACELRP